MYEPISELLLLSIMLFLWLFSSPDITSIKNLLFIGIVYLGVVIRNKR